MLKRPAADAGLFTLRDEDLELREEIDAEVVAWARSRGARPENNAELLQREDLERIDYFDSFPHLVHCVKPYLDGEPDEELYLTSAACYAVYFRRAGALIPVLELVTVRATCRRREQEYARLRRQREFQMREVVAIGSADEVEHHLERGAAFMLELTGRFGITAQFETATDPFFRRDDPKLRHQQLFPTKRELVDDSGLAIGSVNFHRNFFGDRCAIHREDEPVYSGCVAFGLERWIDAARRAAQTSLPATGAP